MKSFRQLQKKRPELAEMLLEMSKDELLENYALEVAEKDELLKFKEDHQKAIIDLECIINFGISWLKANKKGDNYKISITKEKAELIYTNIEKEFI